MGVEGIILTNEGRVEGGRRTFIPGNAVGNHHFQKSPLPPFTVMILLIPPRILDPCFLQRIRLLVHPDQTQNLRLMLVDLDGDTSAGECRDPFFT